MSETIKPTTPKKGDRVNIYTDPYTRKQFVGKGIVGDFAEGIGYLDGEKYWLCEVTLEGDDIPGRFTFSHQDIIKEATK
tara:strand:- start:239 stop:475 length:237 start_codon:yes stop_codon:yes gene_type:complete